MTTRIAAGLKTWLNFGVTVAGNPKQQATFEPTPHAETHSQLKKMWSEQSAKLGKYLKCVIQYFPFFLHNFQTILIVAIYFVLFTFKQWTQFQLLAQRKAQENLQNLKVLRLKKLLQ